MITDEDVARNLRAHVAAVAPTIEVGTARVIPRARRRRMAARGLGAVAFAAVVGAGAWIIPNLSAAEPTIPPAGGRGVGPITSPGMSPGPGPDITEENASAYYDALLASAECLAELGYPVPEPPSRSESITSMLNGDGIIDPMWDPYEALLVEGVSGTDVEAALAECPQPRWGVR